MVKRGFIRVLWGDYANNHDEGWITPSKRRAKMDKEIEVALQNPYNPLFNVYVYGKENYDIPSIKRAIFRFLLVAEKSSPVDYIPVDYSAKAKAHLETLQKQDPKTAREAQRYFFE